MWQAPNVLILDEPTNHLDLDMRHALEVALQDYAGAIVLVSHDRHLLRNSVEQLLLVNEVRLKITPVTLRPTKSGCSQPTQVMRSSPRHNPLLRRKMPLTAKHGVRPMPTAVPSYSP